MYEDTTTRVLNKMVQQPVDNAIDISLDNGARYTERWKGPYSDMRTVTSSGTVVMGCTFQVGKARPQLTGDWVTKIGPPTPVGKMTWMVDAVNVTELEAGDHGLFEVTYRAVPDSMLSAMGGYGWSDVEGAPSAKMVYTENSGWNLRWGTYSRNVLEYCDLSTSEHVQGDKFAHADHIIKCAQLPKPRDSQIPQDWRENPTDHPKQYMWVEPNQAGESVSADVRELCDSEKERQIYNYYVRGVQPVFHYPIVTYTESWEYPLSALDAIQVPDGADKVDKKTVAGDMAGCPFELKGNWQFLDCGTESSIRYTDTIDRSTVCVSLTHTWEGAVVIDENFYSAVNSKRWFPGGGTYDDHGGETEGGGGEI